MGTLETELHEAWADGSIRVRPGETLVFDGTVSGVSVTHIEMTFHANGDGEYRLDHGKVKPPLITNARRRAIENVERALRDAGFSIADSH